MPDSHDHTPAGTARLDYRVLVTGSRNWRHPDTIQRALDHAHDTMLREYGESATFIVVHGNSGNADMSAHLYASQCGWATEPHSADWVGLGRRAGMVRNAEMVRLGARVCLAFIRNHSSGASRCAVMAERAGMPVGLFYDCACHQAGAAA